MDNTNTAPTRRMMLIAFLVALLLMPLTSALMSYSLLAYQVSSNALFKIPTLHLLTSITP